MGLANKSQTLSYRLSGVCVPFFIYGTGQAYKPKVSICEWSCRTIRKDILFLKSHPIYYICGGLGKPFTW